MAILQWLQKMFNPLTSFFILNRKKNFIHKLCVSQHLDLNLCIHRYCQYIKYRCMCDMTTGRSSTMYSLLSHLSQSHNLSSIVHQYRHIVMQTAMQIHKNNLLSKLTFKKKCTEVDINKHIITETKIFSAFHKKYIIATGIPSTNILLTGTKVFSDLHKMI